MTDTHDGTPGMAESRLGDRFSVELIRELEGSEAFPRGAFLFRIGDDYPYEKWRGDRRLFDKRDFWFVTERTGSGTKGDADHG